MRVSVLFELEQAVIKKELNAGGYNAGSANEGGSEVGGSCYDPFSFSYLSILSCLSYLLILSDIDHHLS